MGGTARYPPRRDGCPAAPAHQSHYRHRRAVRPAADSAGLSLIWRSIPLAMPNGSGLPCDGAAPQRWRQRPHRPAGSGERARRGDLSDTRCLSGDEPRFGATRREPAGRDSPNRHGLQRPVPRARALENGRGSKVHHVPEPFDDSERSLDAAVVAHGQRAALPADGILLLRGRRVAGARFAIADSNGWQRAGNKPEEAILQGFLELVVERTLSPSGGFNRPACPASIWPRSATRPQPSRFSTEAQPGDLGLDLTKAIRHPHLCRDPRRSAGPPEDILLGFQVPPRSRGSPAARALTEVGQVFASAAAAQVEASRVTAAPGPSGSQLVEHRHCRKSALLAVCRIDRFCGVSIAPRCRAKDLHPTSGAAGDNRCGGLDTGPRPDAPRKSGSCGPGRRSGCATCRAWTVGVSTMSPSPRAGAGR